jgi:hypothetical protein
MSDLAGACICSYGMSKIADATGDASVPREDGDDCNSGKMSIILVEAVCLFSPPFCILFYSF